MAGFISSDRANADGMSSGVLGSGTRDEEDRGVGIVLEVRIFRRIRG